MFYTTIIYSQILKNSIMKTIILSILFSLLLNIGFTQPIPADNLYLGQVPPGDSAVIFAPGIISLTDRLEGKIAFSPDGNECYFTVWGENYSSCKIYCTKRLNNTWTEQVEAPFSIGQYCGEPFISADGNKLYFDYSYRDKPTNIWMVQRAAQGWSEPRELPSPINSEYWDAGYSESTKGTAFVASSRPGGLDDKGDIWCIRKVPDKSLGAENPGTPLNSTAWEAGLIAPDESFLIFTSERQGGQSYSNLYISFKKDDGSFTIPANMKNINMSGITSTTDPSLSPDGRFLFFVRYDRTKGPETRDIYWVSTKIIDDIKKEVFNKENIK
jgi:Tol biopolymer transport system component